MSLQYRAADFSYRLSARSFYLRRRALIVARYYLGLTYDPDYVFAKTLPADCTIVDIGANGGQSALEFARLRPKARVISLEANPDNLTDLGVVKRVLGDRYTFHHVAVSDHVGQAVLHVPVINNKPVPGEASLHAELFDTVERRFGKITNVLKHPIAIRTLDSFSLAPHLVKIDVQGHELAVLRGMTQTLSRHRPALLLENSSEFAAIKAFLADFGYATFVRDAKTGDMVGTSNPDAVNYFALPR